MIFPAMIAQTLQNASLFENIGVFATLLLMGAAISLLLD